MLLALASASCDANGTVNNIILFISSSQLKQCVPPHSGTNDTVDSGHMMPKVSSTVSIHLLGQEAPFAGYPGMLPGSTKTDDGSRPILEASNLSSPLSFSSALPPFARFHLSTLPSSPTGL